MDFFIYLSQKFTNAAEKENALKRIQEDENSVFSQDDNNVKLNDNPIFNHATSDELEKIDYDKLVKKTEDLKEDEKFSPLEYIIREFFSFDIIKKKVDTDLNGEISKDEAAIYLKDLAAKDGVGTKLSAEDFNLVFEDNKFDLEKELLKYSNEEDVIVNNNADEKPKAEKKKAEKKENAEVKEEAEPTVKNSAPVTMGPIVPFTAPPTAAPAASLDNPSNEVSNESPITDNNTETVDNTSNDNNFSESSVNTSAPTKSSSAGGSSEVTNSSSNKDVSPLAGKSLEELEKEKESRETSLKEKQTAYNNVQSGDTEGIKSAKAKEDKAKEEYLKALDGDEAAAPFKEDIKKNLDNIEQNKKDISETEKSLEENQTNLEKQVSAIENISMQISALQSAKEGLKKTGDEEQDAKIDEKIKEIDADIAAKEKELTEATDQLNKLQDEEFELKSKLGELQEEETRLADEKKELEKKVEDACNEATKAALKAYNDAVENTKKVKDEELKTAKDEVDKAKDAVREVDKKIAEAKAAEIAAKYSSGDGQDMVDFAKQFDKKSQNEMAKILKEKGYQFDRGAWCADGYYYFAKESGVELADWYKNCRNKAYVPTIVSDARKNNAIVAEHKNGKMEGIENVRPGDFGAIKWNKRYTGNPSIDDMRTNHATMVVSVDIKRGKVITMEANTGGDGRSQLEERDISQFHSFLRTTKA